MTNVLSSLTTALAKALHASTMPADAWSFPYPAEALLGFRGEDLFVHEKDEEGQSWTIPCERPSPRNATTAAANGLGEFAEDAHYLVLTDGGRLDVMVRGDARDVTLYRPGQPGYAEHKGIAVRQGMAATGIGDAATWEALEIADLAAAWQRHA